MNIPRYLTRNAAFTAMVAAHTKSIPCPRSIRLAINAITATAIISVEKISHEAREIPSSGGFTLFSVSILSNSENFVPCRAPVAKRTMLPIDALHLAAFIRSPFQPCFLGTRFLLRRIVHVPTDYSKRETSHPPFEQASGKPTRFGPRPGISLKPRLRMQTSHFLKR